MSAAAPPPISTATATATATPTGPVSGFQVSVMDNGLFITTAIVIVAILGLAYYYFFRSTDPFTTRLMWFAIMSIGVCLAVYGGYFIYSGVWGDMSSSGTLTPPVGVNTGAGLVIPGSSLPVQAGTSGANYGMQWWMYIQDWNYGFGQEKTIVMRGSSGHQNPYVFLHPTDNTLCVKINVFSGAAGSGQFSAPSPVGSDGSATDDSFTCTVKNVPIQTWFCVSLSISGRNVDIYQNGLLVRSCLLPGVPQNPTGDLSLMANGGYSGNLAGLYFYGRSLTPVDAMAFYQAGPPPGAVSNVAAQSATTPGKYTVKLATVDKSGHEINKYTF